MYTGLDELLLHVEKLCALAHRDGSKADREAARAALARVIQARLTPATAWPPGSNLVGRLRGEAHEEAKHYVSRARSEPASLSQACIGARAAATAWSARAEATLRAQAHEEAERFNPGWLEDEGEHVVLEAVGARITPLCRQPGRVVLTPRRLYFQPFNVVSSQPTQVFQLDQARPCHHGAGAGFGA